MVHSSRLPIELALCSSLLDDVSPHPSPPLHRSTPFVFFIDGHAERRVHNVLLLRQPLPTSLSSSSAAAAAATARHLIIQLPASSDIELLLVPASAIGICSRIRIILLRLPTTSLFRRRRRRRWEHLLQSTAAAEPDLALLPLLLPQPSTYLQINLDLFFEIEVF
ncbi:hypothetical protein J5N97_014033 [Dioscorea zingiberensis]|uniref:Uncharacterized protein n=1 Tax=Dioscorea zingiberensis TaxID=325984 RepID=A0A9D5HJ91_9LILI|nr:hypothetical protein J5N97_014033 [Dioscorea zingiberensis]